MKITKYVAQKNGYNNEQLYKQTNNTNEKKSKLKKHKQVSLWNEAKKSSTINTGSWQVQRITPTFYITVGIFTSYIDGLRCTCESNIIKDQKVAENVATNQFLILKDYTYLTYDDPTNQITLIHNFQ